ncbi:MAG: hypothetical protein IPP58_13670 [Holophagaceae bacterium]|uniref:Uncharacterized protein n=1 Tax=Candidatus Geothrix skivensis TaxID=2954439 RepID=A0A9D7SKE4_9BACT|nr:hypothetical protein [Candidatus Geothrix skivensis]
MALLRDQPAGPAALLQAQAPKPTTGAGIQGKVKDVNGVAVSGATVSAEGQAAKATTARMAPSA